MTIIGEQLGEQEKGIVGWWRILRKVPGFVGILLFTVSHYPGYWSFAEDLA